MDRYLRLLEVEMRADQAMSSCKHARAGRCSVWDNCPVCILLGAASPSRLRMRLQKIAHLFGGITFGFPL